MSILDDNKAPDQLRRDQWNQQYREWSDASDILHSQLAAGRRPKNGTVTVIDIWEPGKPKRRHYFKTYTVRA